MKYKHETSNQSQFNPKKINHFINFHMQSIMETRTGRPSMRKISVNPYEEEEANKKFIMKHKK